MANAISAVQKEFHPLEMQDYDKLLKGIATRSNKLVQDVKLACMNAVYYSIVAGRPQPAERLLNTVPKYLKRDVESFLLKAGKLGYQGTGRNKHLVYQAKDSVEIEPGKKIELPKQEQKEQAEKFVQDLKVEFKRNPRERKPVTKEDWHEEFRRFLNRCDGIVKKLNDARNAQQDVEEKHAELLQRIAHVFHEYEQEVGIAIDTSGEEEEESEEAKKIKELEERLSKYENNQVELKDSEGREAMKAA